MRRWIRNGKAELDRMPALERKAMVAELSGTGRRMSRPRQVAWLQYATGDDGSFLQTRWIRRHSPQQDPD